MFWVCKYHVGPEFDPLVRFGACRTKDNIKEEKPNNGNVTVFVNFNHIHISKLEEIESTLTAHLQFSMFWMDDRIKTNFSHKTEANSSYDILKLNIKKYLKNQESGISSLGAPLWLPDYNFKNQLRREAVTEEFVLTELRILSENPFHPTLPLIQINLDMRVKVLCGFEFSNYPLDSQGCDFIFRHDSDGCIKYSSYEYKRGGPAFQDQFEAVGFKIRVQPMNERDKCSNDFGFVLDMKRVVLSFILKSYIPTTSIVLISGISFIIPLTAIPGRVTLSVTLFLTLGNIFMQTTVRKCYVS